jgi:hypothetical protein
MRMRRSLDGRPDVSRSHGTGEEAVAISLGR